MRYNRLGGTPLIVSEIGFGGFAIGGAVSGNSYGETDDAQSVRAIEAALDLGCTFFDTADVYGFGHSEDLLGATLKASAAGKRAVVATKVGARFDDGVVRKDFSPGHIRAAVDASLGRLRRDTIDLCQLHDPPLDVLERGEALGCLQDLAAEGKIVAFGASIHSVAEAEAAVRGGAQTLQAAVNVLCLVEPEARADAIFGLVDQTGVGLIAREPLASGFLSGRHAEDTSYGPGDIRAGWSPARRQAYLALARDFAANLAPGVSAAQAALRFVLDQPQVATTIVGIKTAEQARTNFAAAALLPFDALMREAGVPA